MNDETLPATKSRIDTEVTANLSVGEGGLTFVNMSQVMEFAKLMAISGLAVPPHLRGNQGACLGIVIQSVEWAMSPYAVASKSFEVNGRLAFEAQLINAVILRRAPIRGRYDISYSGAGATRRCKVSASLRDGSGTLDYESPEIGQIKPQNSPLWKNDPDQQLFYFSSRAFCRRHFPDVLMGIYDRDELEPGEQRTATTRKRLTLQEKLETIANTHTVSVKPSAVPPNEGYAQSDYDAPRLDIPPPIDPTETQPEAETKRAPTKQVFPKVNDETRAVLEDGILAAGQGLAAYKKWVGRLGQTEFNLAEPHLEWLDTHVAGIKQ